MPNSNSPVTDVTTNNVRCNVNRGPVSGKCGVAAGGTVTVEMHQQPGDRTCAQPAIGGAHYGPVIVYLSKVTDASTADGSSGWFKIFQDTWAKVPGSGSGDSDYWGVKDLEKCCGRMNVKIPVDIPAGDYLLRAEVIALHTAGQLNGAQFYMSCYQLTITGGGSASPALVSFPGAYAAADPGIKVDIHAAMSTYIVPGPTVYASGSTKSPGSGCSGVETGTAAGPALPSTTAPTTSRAPTTTTSSGFVTTTSRTGTTTTSSIRTTSSASSGGCTVAKYGQCRGNGYTGCTVCASGSTCSAVSPPYYSQCI